jgi:hypothetical protein
VYKMEIKKAGDGLQMENVRNKENECGVCDVCVCVCVLGGTLIGYSAVTG